MNESKKADLVAEIDKAVTQIRALGLPRLQHAVDALLARCQREGFGNIRAPLVFHKKGILPGRMEAIRVEVWVGFSPEHLVCDDETAGAFSVLDYKFGNISATLNSEPIPLAPFAATKMVHDGRLSDIMRWTGPTMRPGCKYELYVKHEEDGPRDFTAFAWGHMLEEI